MHVHIPTHAHTHIQHIKWSDTLCFGLSVVDGGDGHLQLGVAHECRMLPSSRSVRKTLSMRRYRERMRNDPVRYRHYLEKQKEYARRSYEKMKSSFHKFDQ